MKQAKFKQIALIALLCLAVTLIAWPLLVQAGPDLPPRDPPPTAPPPSPPDDGRKDTGDSNDNGPSAPIGAYIELQTRPIPPGGWATVQWQDSAGGWQDVGGWHGALGGDGYEEWWVEAKDFGKGPFRWIVTQDNGGPTIGTSDPFDLPSGADERVRVEVALETN